MTSEEKQVAVQPGAEDSLRSTPTPVSQTAAAADHDENQQDDAPDLQMTTLQRRIVTFSLCAVQFVAALDITIIATALPTITSTLSASASEYAWIGSSYTLASTALTPIWAKMSDIFGLKPMLILSNSIFMAGSLIAALAVSPGMLIGGRALQGVGAGGILVLVSITVGFLFKLEDRAKYYGIVGMVWAVANALGPVLGGVFSQSVSWRWCFYINLPFDAVSLTLLVFALKLRTPTTPVMQALREVDWIGSALIVGGTILFLLGLEDGAGLYGWGSARVICLLVFGILLLAAFCGFEAKISNPLIPLRIFSSATNIAAVAVTCLQSFIFIAFDYFLPLYMQVVTRLSPIISGVSLFAMVLPLSFCSTLAGFYVKKTGDYFWPTVLAATVMAVGTGLFVDFGTQRSWAKIICFLAVAGMGTGPIFQTPVIALQSNTRPDDLTAAMSALTFLRSLCTSVSIVVGSVILQAQLGKGSLSYTPTEKTDTERRAYVAALRIMWIFYTAVSVTMICSTFFINRTKVQDATGGDSPKTEGETGGVTELTSDKRPSSDTGSPRRVEPVV